MDDFSAIAKQLSLAALPPRSPEFLAPTFVGKVKQLTWWRFRLFPPIDGGGGLIQGGGGGGGGVQEREGVYLEVGGGGAPCFIWGPEFPPG